MRTEVIILAPCSGLRWLLAESSSVSEEYVLEYISRKVGRKGCTQGSFSWLLGAVQLYRE